ALMARGSLLVGVVRVNSAADRIRCANNLRLIGLAMANCADTMQRYPRAAMDNPSLPRERRLSWLVEFLPFVQSDPLYNKMDKAKGWDAEENRFAALTAWPVFQCPAYRKGPPDSTFFATHYLGMSGVGEDAVSLPQ